MLEINGFLQDQAIQCNALAASAGDSSVREFWLRSARRWLEMLRNRRSYKAFPERAEIFRDALRLDAPS